MFCYAANTLIALIVTKYWKISAHGLGIAMPLAVLLIGSEPGSGRSSFLSPSFRGHGFF
jgi:hypothetical protein